MTYDSVSPYRILKYEVQFYVTKGNDRNCKGVTIFNCFIIIKFNEAEFICENYSHEYTAVSQALDCPYHENKVLALLRILCAVLRVASSGMIRRVALVRTDVSEGLSAFFIRVTRIGELGTTLAVTS
jgi:hypothetical protein